MKRRPIIRAPSLSSLMKWRREAKNTKKTRARKKFYGAINHDNKFNETMTEPYYMNISNTTNTSMSCDGVNCTIEGFSDDWERTVSISVFILFGLIFIAGLIGNGLVVLGKLGLNKFLRKSLWRRESEIFIK